MNWFWTKIQKKSQFVLWLGSYLVIVLISVCANMIGYSYAIRVMQKEVANVNAGSMEQMQLLYDSYFQSIDSNNYQLLNSPAAQTLSGLQISHQREVELLEDLIANIRLSNGAKEWIESTDILFRNKNICVDEGSKYTKELLYEIRYQDFYSSKDAWLNEMFISGLKDYKLITDKNGNTRFLYIYASPTVGEKPIVVVNQISQKVFCQHLSKISGANGGNAMIVNGNGQTLFCASPVQEPLELKLEGERGTAVRTYGGKKYVVNFRRSTILKNAYYVQMIENSTYIKKINATRNLFLLSFLLCIALGGGCAFLFAKLNYRPVKRLISMVREEENSPSDIGEFRYIEKRLKTMARDRTLIEKTISNQRDTLRGMFLSKILMGKVTLEERENKYLSEYGIDLSGENCAVVLFNIMELGVVEDESGTADWEGYKTAHFVISNIFSELMSDCAKVYFCETEDMYAALVNFSDNTCGNEVIVEKAEYANHFLQEHLQMEFVCGISSISSKIRDIPNLYQQASEMMSYRFLTEDTHTFIFDEMMRPDDVYRYTPEMGEELKEKISSGKGEQAAEYIRYIIRTNLENKKMSLDMIRILIAELTSTVLKQTVELENTVQIDTRSLCRLSAELTDYGKVEPAVEELCDFTVRLSGLYADNTQKTVASRCENIKQYIEEHYADPNLNVGSVAGAFGLSLSYLSFYFKDQMSEGLAEYIVKYRVERAKELLRTTDDTVAVIAEKVGFCSSNVFIRAFKKVASVTPGQYKSMNS